jgi:hypothetical protein
MMQPTLRRLALNTTIVRVTLVFAWLAMVALLSLLAVFLDRLFV